MVIRSSPTPRLFGVCTLRVITSICCPDQGADRVLERPVLMHDCNGLIFLQMVIAMPILSYKYFMHASH